MLPPRRSTSRSLPARLPPRSAGFALLVTITLLTLVVLLLVGLATYTRVETAISGNTQKQAQARQNALLALDVALGQLQMHAGPDQRVTATAESFGGTGGSARYTGVWDSTNPGLPARTWLVSGNENNPIAVTPSAPVTTTAELVGRQSTGTANAVTAPLVPITSVGLPGQGGTSTIGRYAWWVGDQGVKAAVAVPDITTSITYAPWDTADARLRLRQQIPQGAGAATAGGLPVFEPRDANSATLVTGDKVTATNQFAFLKTASLTGAAVAAAAPAVGQAILPANFFSWSPNNFAVLADTKAGGLRRDLSVDPTPLGAGFAAWSAYGAYTEDPKAPRDPRPVPDYGQSPIRRRLFITPPVAADGATFACAPVLSLFFIQFNVRTVSASSPALEVRARMVAQLWNPYTAAFVPEPLTLEITGLPTVVVSDSNGGNTPIDLQALFGGGGPMRVNLTATDTASAGGADDASWLPGRVYYWRTKGGSSSEWRTEFYSRTLSVAGADTWTVPVGAPIAGPISSDVTLQNFGGPAEITATMKRASDGVVLSTVTGPRFEPFSTTPRPVSDNNEFNFGFPFRLSEPNDYAGSGGDGTWLTALDRDPRAPAAGSVTYRAFGGGPDPSAYIGVGGSSVLSDPAKYFDRVAGSSGMDYNEDFPVFELPRSPLLSLGQLQHLQVPDRRPFCIGNPWGVTASLGSIPAAALFDRFFFSGLDSGVVPTVANGLPVVPNPALRVMPRLADGTRPTVGDVASAGNARMFIARGAFNLNSVSTPAWIAVLRGLRFPAPTSFSYLNASASTGSAGDTSTATVQSADAQFFRFSQSAQETYLASPTYAQSGSGGTSGSPSVFINTHLYRRGMRTLDAPTVTALATAITANLRARLNAFGPYRSLEDFLGPDVQFGTQSLLAKSIADVPAINQNSDGSSLEFSSQFLTQADIMTALAPVLFPRSDTFVIRTYGEAVNPATGVAEGRAWCEATVQRVPEYVDPSQDAAVAPNALNPLNQTHGRRFKVVSFRWLTRSDI